ncbi:MAG: class I SAM-dependent methyltransferase [Candidatus Latescibacteria bacterium]|nr:class I SAM-dependent methyltransferase [Candidatus Latescibacterota bacterium]
MLKDYQDAFGHEIYDYFTNKGGYEIVERDDGFFDISGGPKPYLADYNDWPSHQKKAMRYVRGKVLDIGCGAGRHSLYLQKKGFDVLGLDISPLAVEVCKLRGLKKVKVMSISEISSKLGTFNTILILGNNFGLFGSFERAKRLLKRFYKITSEKGRIIAESNDPYKTDIPEHLEYQQLNRQRGRMPGQLKIKVRYKKYATPWFDYLLVSKEEMAEILNGTGWKVKKFINSEGSVYIAIIEKEVS